MFRNLHLSLFKPNFPKRIDNGILLGYFSKVSSKRLYSNATSEAFSEKKFSLNRQLPDIKDNRYRNVSIVLGGVLLWGAALSIAFNYHKLNTSIVKATRFAVKYHPLVQQKLGENTDLTLTKWISGDINHMRGVVDIKYRVKGSKGDGEIKFKSTRHKGIWKIHTFTLTFGNEIYNLLDESNFSALLSQHNSE